MEEIAYLKRNGNKTGKYIMKTVILLVVITIESVFGIFLFQKQQEDLEKFKKKITLLEYKNLLYEDALLAKKKPKKKTSPSLVTSSKVRVTAYHPKSRGINSDKDPKTTATMTVPRAGKTAAISSSLFKKGWLGKKVYIDGYGVFVIEDRMSKSLKGDRIDLCVGSKLVARNFKSRDGVHASILTN